MRCRTATALLALAAGVALGACGGDDEPAAERAGAGCPAVAGGVVRIVALDIAWDADCLEAPAGEPFTVVVDNRDDGVNHDFRLSTGDEVLKTPLEPGPVVQRLEVPALEAGEYAYVCEIHPNMTGVLQAG